jgi:hypothetical protein
MGDNWRRAKIDAIGEIFAPALLCPPHIRQNPALSSEKPMASRVSYGIAIIDGRRIGCACSGTYAGSSLSAGVDQMNVAVGNV